MKCARCKKNKAEFGVNFTHNNKVNNLALCTGCIEKKEKSLHLPSGTLKSIAKPLILNIEQILKPGVSSAKTCPNCKTSYADFRSSRLLGCENCYLVFREELSNIIKLAHGQNTYAGQSPKRAAAPFKPLAKALAEELKEAVKAENFERAQIVKTAYGKTKEKTYEK